MTTIQIEDPSDGAIKPSFQKDPKLLVEATKRTFLTHKTLPLSFRKQQLDNLLAFLKENRQEMADALKSDLGRPRQESNIGDIGFCINETTYLRNNLDELAKVEKPYRDLKNWFDGVCISSEPYGVVLVIGVWNYPFQLTLIPLAGAIAAGNCVVIKLPEQAIASSHLMATVLPKYLDNDCYHIYEGGIPETTALLQEKFDYIFFTGSHNIGKIIYAAASKHLTPVTLELGGKSPVYIDDTADMLIAAKRILWGKITNAGQTCIAPDYILCTKEVEKQFLQAMEVAIDSFYGDNFNKPSDDYCKILTERHFNRLVNLMKGHRIAIGGKFDAKVRFFQFTILVDVKPDDLIMQEEIFGPILPIVNIENIVEAVDFIIARDKPLAAYIFSKNKEDIDFFLNTTSSGNASVNDTVIHCIIKQLGFGGVGASGMGAYHGKRNFETFTHKKGILIRDYNPLFEKISSIRYPPYTKTKTILSELFCQERPEIPFDKLIHLMIFMLGILVAYLVQKIYNNISEAY